ncbi:hypothetical protein BGX23_011171 [Mortierella sp. AD031]|nr:hypothetical protein BGX23_011171 [Mortierella sp. AD031]
MDPLSRLPPECLQLILHTLAQQGNFATLAALLQSNNRTLLDQASLASPPPILSLAFGISPHDAQRPVPLDYIAYVRHLDLDPLDKKRDRSRLRIEPKGPEGTEYLRSEDFKTFCQLDRLFPDFVQWYGEDLLKLLFSRAVKRETTWTIAIPILGQLQ